jgi:hypothetical protein
LPPPSTCELRQRAIYRLNLNKLTIILAKTQELSDLLQVLQDFFDVDVDIIDITVTINSE